ncbi:FAD:protein FMN transferase [Aureispira sp. CCB-QB1]|uniref:FAD:protein FMN transferase n=1 Tax=Aureispira sp. CCB-QB1 TaxID=1313421 RepID=UPI000697FF93|nr:FAD:protein FMN transferase [Aureispira sp. CCB-QB1]
MLVLLLFLMLTTYAQSQTTTNQEEAIRWAKEKNKAILLVFSGSDWCQPCIRFDKNVLQESSFQAYAEEALVVLKCDFPQRSQLPKDVVQQNEALAERFNPQGEFPKLLLLNQDFKLLAHLNYKSEATHQFVAQIKQYLPLETGAKEYRKKVPLMGSFFEFIVVAPKKEAKAAWTLIEDCVKEAKRIEALISEWIPSSDISKINQQAGKEGVRVDEEVYKLLQRSIAISQLTQGAFDITFLAYYDYWKFDQTQVFPFDSVQVKQLSQYVDYQQVELLPDYQVRIPARMRIGLGGIGQGYAVDRIKEFLLSKGVENFVINSSGDIYAHGQRPDGSPWKVGVASPLDRDKIVKWLPVENFAVVTSGTSEKNFEYQNTIYSHIINTHTGFPIEGLQSVTVISDFTEIADALATSILILGTEIGLDLINQMPQTHCIIIDKDQNIHYSDDLQIKK